MGTFCFQFKNSFGGLIRGHVFNLWWLMIHTNLPVTFCLDAMTRTLFLRNNNSLKRATHVVRHRKSYSGSCCSLRCRCLNGSVDNILSVIKNSSLDEPRTPNAERRTPRLFAGFLKRFERVVVIVIMSGYTSSYRSYDSRKLANGSLKVNEDTRVANGMCEDEDDCCIVRVEWNYRLEVSKRVRECVLYKKYWSV